MHRPLSIYVHYPYCSQICTFCAFNKYRLPKTATLDNDHKRLLDAYKKELRHGLRKLALDSGASVRRQVRSVYFGGGTPSLFPELVPELLHVLADEFWSCELADDAEITLEANPTSLPPVTQLAERGVTRISLGVQSLGHSARLKSFNREHDVRGALHALDRLVHDRDHLKHGFTFDLMFGNPLTTRLGRPSLEDWSKELDRAIPYAKMGGHLSLYELTLEHGTPLARDVKAGRAEMPNDDSRADEYDLAVSAMTSAGFEHYEVSSFCLPGHQSRHNMAFWMGDDLLGIGPGAHGRLATISTSTEGAIRTRNVREPRRWAAQVDDVGHGIAKIDRLSATNYAQEMVAVGLRTLAGVSDANMQNLAGRGLADELDMEAVSSLVDQGYLEHTCTNNGSDALEVPAEWRAWYKRDTHTLRTTTRGRSVLDLILPQILK